MGCTEGRFCEKGEQVREGFGGTQESSQGSKGHTQVEEGFPVTLVSTALPVTNADRTAL